MADFPFTVKHFLVCQSVQWEGVPGPDTKRTLEGVGYKFQMEAGAEPPFELNEMWLYIRMYNRDESKRPLRFRMVSRRIYPEYRTKPFIYSLGSIDFRKSEGVRDVAWPLRPLTVPFAGQYEFRLQCSHRTDIGLRWKTVAREYVLFEEQR